MNRIVFDFPDKKGHEGKFFISEEKTFMAGIFWSYSAAERHIFSTILRLQPQF